MLYPFIKNLLQFLIVTLQLVFAAKNKRAAEICALF